MYNDIVYVYVCIYNCLETEKRKTKYKMCTPVCIVCIEVICVCIVYVSYSMITYVADGSCCATSSTVATVLLRQVAQ